MFSTNIIGGDLGYWWRVQEPRSLADLDKLHQYKLFYGNQLDAAKRKEIEDHIEWYADADQFRIFHAKGRFRGIISASVITTGAFAYLAHG